MVTVCARSSENSVSLSGLVRAAISLLFCPPVSPGKYIPFTLTKVSLYVCYILCVLRQRQALGVTCVTCVTCSLLLSLLKRSPSCPPASKGRRVRALARGVHRCPLPLPAAAPRLAVLHLPGCMLCAAAPAVAPAFLCFLSFGFGRKAVGMFI